MTLNKFVCQACCNAKRAQCDFQGSPFYWFFEDSERFARGLVACPSKNKNRPITLPFKEAEKSCPYLLEHLLKSEQENA